MILTPKWKISSRWGLTRNDIVEKGKIDAALNDGKKTLLFSGGNLIKYSNKSPYKLAEKDSLVPL